MMNNSFSELLIKNPLALLLMDADITDHASSTVTYYGFCEPKKTTDTSDATWAILRVTKSAPTEPYIEKHMWANGQQNRTLVFDDRAGYDYYYRKF